MKTKGKIRKYIEDYKFNSLFFKNLLLLLILIIVPLTGAFVLSYYAYSSMQRNEARAVHEKITADICAQWGRILKESRTELGYLSFNSNVELFMYDTSEIKQLNYRLNTIQELIRLPVLSRNYINSVYIYSMKSGKVISLEGISNFDNFKDKTCMDSYLGQESTPALYQITVSETLGYGRKQLSVYQDVKYGAERNGIMVMNLDPEALAKEIAVPEHVRMYLTDGETILFSTGKDLIGEPAGEMEDYGAVLRNGTVFLDQYSISSKVEPLTELEVITFMNTEGYQNQLSTVWNMMVISLVVMLFVTLGLSVFISVRIFQPIGAIVSAIKENQNVLMGKGELFQEKDELEYVLSSIRKTAYIKKDVDEELAHRVRLLKKAQAVALQSQINPHFLNNTLETINWKAMRLLGCKNEVSEMTGALSRMLRTSLENSDTIISMGMEIEHCMDYLEIQKERYEDKFEVIWEIPKEVYDCRTIRIILQPIVENAIYHGMKYLSNKGQIRISGRIDSGNVEITVADNGLGMTKEELRSLNDNMKSNVIKESSHIGVANVNQRLKLYFGEEYGVFISSQEGVGTQVRIRFPEVKSETAGAQ